MVLYVFPSKPFRMCISDQLTSESAHIALQIAHRFNAKHYKDHAPDIYWKSNMSALTMAQRLMVRSSPSSALHFQQLPS